MGQRAGSLRILWSPTEAPSITSEFDSLASGTALTITFGVTIVLGVTPPETSQVVLYADIVGSTDYFIKLNDILF